MNITDKEYNAVWKELETEALEYARQYMKSAPQGNEHEVMHTFLLMQAVRQEIRLRNLEAIINLLNPGV